MSAGWRKLSVKNIRELLQKGNESDFPDFKDLFTLLAFGESPFPNDNDLVAYQDELMKKSLAAKNEEEEPLIGVEEFASVSLSQLTRVG